MVAMPIDGENLFLKKSSGTKKPMTLDLGKFAQMVILGWPLPF